MITAYTKTGVWHESGCIPCQDAVYHIQTPELTVLSLADGISACANSHIGAQIACRAAADYLAEYRDTFTGCDDRKVAYLIVDQVRFSQEAKARELGCSPDSLASTLVLCCIHRATGEAMLFQLGDCAAYALDARDAIPLLESGHIAGGPPNTMTRNAHRAARIRHVFLPDVTRVLLCSDGLLKALNDPELGSAYQGMLLDGDLSGLSAALDGASFADDISFICS